MKLLDLFSGIGGFSLGAEYNNIETIGFVEKDVFCQKVLRKHWPNVPILGDIRDVTKDTFESVDIVSGGFPCQPFSVAGKRRGTDDDRYLWDETIRVVSLYKPRWFVGENVEGIVNIQNGMVLRQVQDDLEKEGFEVQCGIIPASGIGAWHQRKRVWIIAHSNSNRESRRSQYVQERSRELGESHVSHTNNDGLKGGQSETCNKDAPGKNDTSFRGESASNTSRSDDDRRDKKKSRIDESISRSHDGDQEKSTSTKGFRGLSKKSDKCSAVGKTSADQENNDRTLVQERQMFQLSESRGLGNNQTSSERNQIRSRDDNVISDRMDTNNVSNTISELSDGCGSTTRLSETELKGMVSDKERNWDKVRSETERCSEQATTRGNVSNTHDSRNRTSRYGSQREGEKNAKEGQNRSQFESSRHSKNDVSNTNSSLRRGRATVSQGGKNKIWGFYTEEEKQNKSNLRSETIRCDVVFGEQENVSNSQHQRWSDQSGRGHRELGEKSREKEKRGDQSALCSSTRSAERGTDEDVSNSSSKGQLHRESGNLGEESRKTQGARENDTQGIEDTGARGEQENIQYSHDQRSQEHQLSQKSEEQTLNSGELNAGKKPTQSWWEIESSVCTVPNGVSYRLDKDRVNQIKSLGNSIVPQIAYQIFKAIVTVDKEE